MPEDRSPRRRPERRQHRSTRPTQAALVVACSLGFSLILAAVAGTYVVAALALSYGRRGARRRRRHPRRRRLVELSGLEGQSMLALARRRGPRAPARAAAGQSRRPSSATGPQTVTITIEERVPVAFWSVGGRDYVVDVDGVVLAAGVPSGPAPRIVEPDATASWAPATASTRTPSPSPCASSQESPRFLGQSVQRARVPARRRRHGRLQQRHARHLRRRALLRIQSRRPVEAARAALGAGLRRREPSTCASASG